jgi:hypothetical protein
MALIFKIAGRFFSTRLEMGRVEFRSVLWGEHYESVSEQ